MYYIDGNLASVKNIPEALLPRLEDGAEMDIVANQPVQVLAGGNADVEDEVPAEPTKETVRPEPRVCFIDGKEATHRKFLQLVNVWICDEHYGMSSGKIVQKMRELDII
jgi:hypothetical protein